MRRMNFLLLSTVVLLAAMPSSAQFFIPIEPLPGHNQTIVTGVSSDGSVVVGTSGQGADSRAFYWTADTGIVELPSLRLASTTAADVLGIRRQPTQILGDDSLELALLSTMSRAEGVSGDGRVIVGFSGGVGVRWVDGEIEILAVTDEIPFVYPVSASGDGDIITGEGEGWEGLIAFRWTPDDLRDLGGVNPGDYEVLGTAIAENGQAIVGLSEGWGGAQGFRWTVAGDMIGLGWLPGYQDFSTATSLSANGDIIGGQATYSYGWAATAWTEEDGWMVIPSVIDSGMIANAVHGVSGDGSVMVGLNTGASPAARTVFIWDTVNGSRRLQQVLEEEYQIDLMGWQLADFPSPYNNAGNVAGISTDGLTIVGTTLDPATFQPRGWLAYLGGTVSIEEPGQDPTPDIILPTALAFSQATPNPFNPSTTISFNLPHPDEVTVSIHDPRGRLVRTLTSDVLTAGRHQVTWDGRTDQGQLSPSGIYMVVMVTSDGSQRTLKITLAK